MHSMVCGCKVDEYLKVERVSSCLRNLKLVSLSRIELVINAAFVRSQYNNFIPNPAIVQNNCEKCWF